MSKNHRGTGLRSLPSHGRDECPVCHKTNIKVLYEVEIDGQKIKVCKFCNAAMKNKARKEAPAKEPSAAPAANEAPVEASAAPAAEANEAPAEATAES
ncbi:hypothetical protein [Treponema socranskii]|uniref:hypothetical protein n=1 Tax=Treponema socranskii TaxID=53419 RepID=UPI00360E2D3E